MNTAEIIADIRRRYEGTYCWLTMDEITKETLVKVTRIADDSSKNGVLLLDSLEYGSLTINMGSEGHQLRFKYPPVGVFQHDTDSFVFTRRPARQYRRGICPDNSALRTSTVALVGNRARFTALEVASAFKHKTYSLSEALEMLRLGRARSVALENNFTVALSLGSGTNYIVLHWTHPVARCNEVGKITQVYEDVYRSGLARVGFTT